LRLADYNQGRRFGNANGQAGAFGTTNFGQAAGGFGQPQNTTGGFGQPAAPAAGGLFGQAAATSSPFGTSQPAQSGFGTTTNGGGLFGQSKPGGLFGTTSAQPSTGLFGTTNNQNTGNTGGAFGTGGGGLFGNNQQNQQQSKPFSFGGTTATAGGFGGTNTGFGANNSNNTTGGGGLFGQTTQTSNAFGQPQQPAQNASPFGGFGQTNQNQNNTTSAFGGFGQPQNQEQKPGGLFGTSQPAANAGGGLFGNNNNQQQSTASGGGFGSNNNNQTSSLFNKPATGGAFGTANTNNTNNVGGLFGTAFGTNSNNQNQQNQGGGIFGNNANQQQKPGGLFGNINTGGGSLFGTAANNNQQPSGGIFNSGGSNNQQQPQQGGGLFGNSAGNNATSLFGNSQQQPQQPPQPNFFQQSQSLQTSILDPNPFGSPSIFTGLPPPPQTVTGPLATPISPANKAKKNAILPRYKMTPNASLLHTPQRRGFGFSYSTYGTPGSVSSNASTPGGMSSSLLYGSVGRGIGLGKSLSTSNLRGTYDSDAGSILTPGAFSAGSSRYGGAGSMKRLIIDRTLRTDLFGDRGSSAALPSPEKDRQPGILKKKVSFDASALGGNGERQNGTQAHGANDNESSFSATPSAEEQGYLRTARPQAKSESNGSTTQPEMEQVRGNELAIVHEDEAAEPANAGNSTISVTRTQEDQEAGDYWMRPSKLEIGRMSKDQQRRVSGFSVGREGCGHVEFNMPVDLTLTPLDDIFNNVVVIELRSLTVYPDQSRKPAQGKGLNVPSTIYLENSWPRQKDRTTPLHEKNGPRFNKHIDRLRKVGGTEFVRYEKDSGIWVFKVPHFTTYGFDYEDDASEGESLHTSMLSEPPDTPTPKSRASSNNKTPTASALTQRSFASTNESSHVDSSLDDTFAFRKKALLPGAFEEAPAIEETDDHEMQGVNNTDQSFLDERLAASPSDSGEDEPSELGSGNGEVLDHSLVVRDEDEEEVGDDDMEMEMAGAFPLEEEAVAPAFGTPGRGVFSMSGDWAEELQKTVSPKKQDRQALRETQALVLENRDISRGTTPRAKGRSKGSKPELATSIDLMNSLFGQDQARRSRQGTKQTAKGTGLKVRSPLIST